MSKLLVFPALDRSTSPRFTDGTTFQWRTSASGLLDEIEKEWSIVTGQPSAESLIYGWTSMIHPEDRDRMLRQWYCSHIHIRPFRCEFRVLTASGLYVPGISVANPAFDLQGALTHWLGESVVKMDIPRRVLSFGG